MRIQKISRETHPEEFKFLDKMEECEKQGHGAVVIAADGSVICRECEQVLDSVSPEAIEEEKAMLAEIPELTQEDRVRMDMMAERARKCQERGHGEAVLKPGDIVVCRDCGVDLYQEQRFERGEWVDVGLLYPDVD
jgi:hypothetical protein